MMRLFMILLTCLTFSVACSEEEYGIRRPPIKTPEEEDPITEKQRLFELGYAKYSESYIESFFDLKDILINFKGNALIIHPLVNNSYEKGCNEEQYEQLLDKYNDRGWCDTVPLGSHSFSCEEFVKVSVTSDARWSDQLPAGSLLDRICIFGALSPYRYIESGYTDFDWTGYHYIDSFIFWYHHIPFAGPTNYWIPTPIIESLYPVYKRIQDLEPDDLKLLPYICSMGVIEFDQLPDSGGPHKITVTMTRTDGSELSATILKHF